MKKKKIKNLNLKKKSISNLSNEVKGGAEALPSILVPCWSHLSCPTINCTNHCPTSTCANSIPYIACTIR